MKNLLLFLVFACTFSFLAWGVLSLSHPLSATILFLTIMPEMKTGRLPKMNAG